MILRFLYITVYICGCMCDFSFINIMKYLISTSKHKILFHQIKTNYFGMINFFFLFQTNLIRYEVDF